MKKIILLFIGIMVFACAVKAEIRDVYLHGSFNDWKDCVEYKFEPVGESENYFMLVVTLPAASSSNPNKLKVYDNVEIGQKYRGSSSSSDKEADLNGVVKSLNSFTGDGNESSVTISNTIPLRVCVEYWAKYKFSGDTDESYHSALRVTPCPENLYIFGQLKGAKSWNEGKCYQGVLEENMFCFIDVNVSGRVGSNGQRENYFAFFDKEVSGESFGKSFPRFGGSAADRATSGDYKDGQNVVILKSDFTEENEFTASRGVTQYTSQPSSGDSNFRLPDGMYDIKVDFFNGKIYITLLDLSYRWYDADGNMLDTESELNLIKGETNRLQLGSRGDVNHPAALNASVEVVFTPPVEEEKSEISLFEDDPDYSIDEDGVMTLHKIGRYEITASLPEEFNSEYLGINPVTIVANVGVNTGVDSICSDSSRPVYFNLQGHKVDNPVSGIYIRLLDGKFTKIIK